MGLFCKTKKTKRTKNSSIATPGFRSKLILQLIATHVHGVSNTIAIKQAVKPFEIKEKIKKAFQRMADVDAKNITVDVEGHTVKLRGKVHSISEKNEARKTAYFAPGVYEVENELEVVL